MCGIAGILRFDDAEVDPQVIERLSRSMRHRGPDDFGYLGWSGEAPMRIAQDLSVLRAARVGLAHRRLSILDLTADGRQPMATPDGRYAIVFNGEIYNYVELRAELEATGRSFHTRTDTEVLLAAYAEWGIAALRKLVGMFAFGVLDVAERRLFLARDFFGIKPLYYARPSGGFAFASEIKSLLEVPGVARDVHPGALYDYLRFGLTDRGEDTLFAAVRQLPPGHYMDVRLDKPGAAEAVCYWQPGTDETLDISFDEAAERLRELFLDNIRLHLRSDVPVGTALSGGIDSSAIVTAMRRLVGEKLDIHTMSFIASSEELSEESWVDLVGAAAGTTVHKTHPRSEDLLADLNQLIAVQDEPFGSTSIFAQLRIFRLASEHGIKVMLDGQGADELLGGYHPHLSARLAGLFRRGRCIEATRFLRRISRLPGVSGREALARAVGELLPECLTSVGRRLTGRELTPKWLAGDWFADRGVRAKTVHTSGGRHLLLDRLVEALGRNSLPLLLRHEDRNSMAYSIESRTPFLTPALVHFVFSLPEEYLISRDGVSKAVFREAMRGIVPDAVLARRDKIGFAAPDRQWLDTLRPWVDEVLDGPVARRVTVIDLDVARRQWRQMSCGDRPFDVKVWRWVNLLCWADLYGVTFDA